MIGQINENPLVSVLMNCYNGERFLKEAIDSIINQTYQNWELVFWDNQSKDNSAGIAKGYNDPRIKYFYASQFTGLNKARGLAYAQTKGKYVAVLDADDVAMPMRLEKQVKFLNNNLDYGLVGTFTETIDENSNFLKKYITPLDSDIIIQKLGYSNLIFHSSIMFRKELGDKLGGYDQIFSYAHDYNLTLNISKHSKIGMINLFLCRYRVLNSSFSGNKKNKIQNLKETNILFNKAYKILPLSPISILKNRYKKIVIFIKLILLQTFKY